MVTAWPLFPQRSSYSISALGWDSASSSARGWSYDQLTMVIAGWRPDSSRASCTYSLAYGDTLALVTTQISFPAPGCSTTSAISSTESGPDFRYLITIPLA